MKNISLIKKIAIGILGLLVAYLLVGLVWFLLQSYQRRPHPSLLSASGGVRLVGSKITFPKISSIDKSIPFSDLPLKMRSLFDKTAQSISLAKLAYEDGSIGFAGQYTAPKIVAYDLSQKEYTFAISGANAWSPVISYGKNQVPPQFLIEYSEGGLRYQILMSFADNGKGNTFVSIQYIQFNKN